MKHFVKDTLPNGKSFDRPTEHLPEHYSDPLSMENIHEMKFSPANRIDGIKYFEEDADFDNYPVFEIELKLPFENFEQELALDYWGSFDLSDPRFITEKDGVRFFFKARPYYGGMFDVTAFFHEVGTGYITQSTPGYSWDPFEYVEFLDGKVGDATDSELNELGFDLLKTFTTPDGREWRLILFVHED